MRPQGYHDNRYSLHAESQLQDAGGIAGQNNPNPLATFTDHQVVRVLINGVVRWLDPSYGVEYTGNDDDARLLKFQTMSVYGFTDQRNVSDIELLLQLDINKDGRITGDDELDPDPDDDIDLATLYYWIVSRASMTEIYDGLTYSFGDVFDGRL